MKDLIKVRINSELPQLRIDAWYYGMKEMTINVIQNPFDSSQYKIPENDLFICKKYCTVISDTEQEPKQKDKYQPDEWVVWSGSHPIVAQILKRVEDDIFNEECYELKTAHNHTSCAVKYLRKAFPHEIPAPEPRLCDKKDPLIGTKEYINSFPKPEVEPFRHYTQPVEPVLIAKAGEEQKQESERIPFDLEKWKTGRYDVVQRNGLPAEILKTDLNNEQPLVVAFSTGIETQGASRFSLNGRYYLKSEDDRDLFLIPKTETVWVNHFESPEYTSETMAINESAFCPNGYKLIETIEVKRPIK